MAVANSIRINMKKVATWDADLDIIYDMQTL